MTRLIALICLLGMSAGAFADANDGEYLGYQLGKKFSVPRGAEGMGHITGATVYFLNPKRQPHHIDSVSLYVSPKSLIIGSIFGEWYFPNPRAATDFADRYLSSLEQKYGHWTRKGRSLTNGDYQLWVNIERKPPIVDHWPSHKNSRVAIGLIYAPDEEGRRDWMALIDSEVRGVKVASK